MMKAEKYIMFLKKQKGNDGYIYIKNVKYRIQKETVDAFILAGKSRDSSNVIHKSRLKNKFILGNIFRDYWER